MACNLRKCLADFQIGKTRAPTAPEAGPLKLKGPGPMTLSQPAHPPAPALPADRALQATGVLWFIVAAIGQLAFVWFILAHFGGHTLAGNPEGWNDKPLIDGHIPGDTAGNTMFAIHALFAAIITVGGLLQLVPQVRRAAPWFHRWSGRLFLVAAGIMAVGGLWLVWGRGTYLSLVSGISVSLNGVLILLFAALAWRLAVQRRIDAHRRWAMRLFMVVNGVWFLRVGLMGWVLANQGPVGMNRTLSGPADLVITYGSYLIPLALLELYFAARRARSPAAKWAASVLVLLATTFTALGVFGTIAIMWRPYY